jgi:hypothetical protein
MANQIIVDELDTPGTHGLNSVSRTYTDPGGVSRSSPTGVAAIITNTDLFNLKDVERYQAEIDPPSQIWSAFTATSLEDLSAAEREDFAAFVEPQISNGPISNPDLLLKDLIDDVVFSGVAGDNPTVRSNYDALIQELTSIAIILDVNASQAEIQFAMVDLGWITDP